MSTSFDVEFLLVAIELTAIQKKTNYPTEEFWSQRQIFSNSNVGVERQKIMGSCNIELNHIKFFQKGFIKSYKNLTEKKKKGQKKALFPFIWNVHPTPKPELFMRTGGRTINANQAGIIHVSSSGTIQPTQTGTIHPNWLGTIHANSYGTN